MNHDAKVQRWLDKYMEHADPVAVSKVIGAKGVRLRVIRYAVDGKHAAQISVEDSWYSRVSRLSKQLNEEFKSNMFAHPAWLVLACGQSKLDLEEILTMVDQQRLSYSGFVDESEIRSPGDCDSWH